MDCAAEDKVDHDKDYEEDDDDDNDDDGDNNDADPNATAGVHKLNCTGADRYDDGDDYGDKERVGILQSRKTMELRSRCLSRAQGLGK